MMDDRTKKALLGSIEKWRKIAYEGGEDHGVKNCPLCFEFLGGLCCTGCPVRVVSGRYGCGGTPYNDWAKHLENVHLIMEFPRKVMCEECRVLAERELKFLVSLLTKDTKEESKMPEKSEDRELKVMESRVKSAMAKCPAGKEILNELFPDVKKEKWRDVTYMMITTERTQLSTQFVIENGRLWKKIGD